MTASLHSAYLRKSNWGSEASSSKSSHLSHAHRAGLPHAPASASSCTQAHVFHSSPGHAKLMALPDNPLTDPKTCPCSPSGLGCDNYGSHYYLSGPHNVIITSELQGSHFGSSSCHQQGAPDSPSSPSAGSSYYSLLHPNSTNLSTSMPQGGRFVIEGSHGVMSGGGGGSVGSSNPACSLPQNMVVSLGCQRNDNIGGTGPPAAAVAVARHIYFGPEVDANIMANKTYRPMRKSLPGASPPSRPSSSSRRSLHLQQQQQQYLTSTSPPILNGRDTSSPADLSPPTPSSPCPPVHNMAKNPELLHKISKSLAGMGWDTQAKEAETMAPPESCVCPRPGSRPKRAALAYGSV